MRRGWSLLAPVVLPLLFGAGKGSGEVDLDLTGTLTAAAAPGEVSRATGVRFAGTERLPNEGAAVASLRELEMSAPEVGDELRQTTWIRALFPPETRIAGQTCELTRLRRRRPWDRHEVRLLGLALPPQPGRGR